MVITEEMNDRLTRVGPGTPMGEVFRRYWIPALLSEEIREPDGPPVRVRLLGEDLVAFRDSDGEVGLVSAYCAHRRGPLFFGRNEENGLRCVYHGWKYDRTGQCVDLPSEPTFSRLIEHAKIRAYPTYEKGGAVFTYMGPTEATPPQPDYEWMRVPPTHCHITKSGEHCNFLQGIEGGVDTIHTTFLHRNDLSRVTPLRMIPNLEVETTDYGFRYGAVRNLSEEQSYVRLNLFMMPNQQVRPTLFDLAKYDGTPAKFPSIEGHIWVPMDDETTMVYNWHYAATDAPWMTHEGMIAVETTSGRGEDDFIPGTYWMKRNLANDYLVDREVQRDKTFTGIKGVNTQDYAVQEGMGAITRRDLELLGTSDKAVVAARELFIEALDDVEAGRSPRGSHPDAYRDVRAGEALIPRGLSWQESTKHLTESFWE